MYIQMQFVERSEIENNRTQSNVIEPEIGKKGIRLNSIAERKLTLEHNRIPVKISPFGIPGI
jgi:hypothetical protein